uniref:Sulfatase N-terminal domain-containing protein n=1 Tax=Panagrolaimus superbus TaxID=310955 RepID=A0A914YZS3_9BILA
MPFTLKFMREKDFQILYGYTKIGDNSAINLLGVLAGMVYGKEEDRGFKDLVDSDSFFDFKKYDKDFGQLPETIIARAKKAGCVTMWNDEIANSGYGLYHYYEFKGFHEPIADYYFRPFYEYQYQKLAANSACNHGKNIIPKWIGLWEEFSTKYSNHCHFSFNFFTGLTHASSNNLELYDIPVSDALARMESTGVLDNTFLLIMGDHGQRIVKYF